MTQYKYLGIELTNDLTNAEDVRRVHYEFNKSAGMLIRRFYSVTMDLKKKSFDSLCLSMYGMNLVKKSAGALL